MGHPTLARQGLGAHTLAETKREVDARLGDLRLDYSAMAVASNLFRAANAVRNLFERSVLSEINLPWTAFVVLWATWIWEPIGTRQIALEGGFSQATLTGCFRPSRGVDGSRAGAARATGALLSCS